MSSGRLRLSVRGNEDVPISGSPQYAYYLKNFARQEQYENLFVDNSLQTIVQGRTPTYGDTISFQVPRRGDLLSKVFLKIVLPPSYLYSNLVRGKTGTFNLYSILEYVELVIGGQLIQRLTGEYILNWISLYYSSNDLEFYNNVTEMKIQDLKKTYASFGQFVLLPIPFYFSQKGQELPLIALSRQNVIINIKLAIKPPIIGLPDLTDVTVSTEYILLGNENTKNIFINNGITYRVTQVQMNYDTISSSETQKVIDLDFQNPVREMFVCIQPQSYQDINNAKYYNYFGNYRNTFINYRNTTSGWYLSEQHITGMSLRFNNNEYINEEGSGSASMLSLTIPQKYYANSDNIQQFKGYVYPFVIDPLSPHPQGHINMSRILKKQMTLFMNASQFTRTVRVYASSYNIMVIKDGISGLVFTNPSYYNPKLVLGESGEIKEGVLPTDTEVLTPDQGFYYAVKIEDGNNIVGIQIYTEESPEFASPQELQDNQFSYLFNTNDTFTSNATLTDTSQYAPGTISQLLRTVIQVPNEQNALTTELYDVHTTNNYIFTSNYGFIRSLRLAIRVHEEGTSGPDGIQKVLTSTDYNSLSPIATINLYSSNTFFDSNDIEGWLSNATVQTKVIRDENASTSVSDGYYYVGNSVVDQGGTITGYNKVYFARTYDFGYVLDIDADSTDQFDEVLNISEVTYRVNNISGTGYIQTYLGSSTRGEPVYYFPGEITKTITFSEELVRGVKIYSVRVFRTGETDVTRSFSVIAGGNAPPLYHAIQYLPPEGSSTVPTLVAIQSYSPEANVANLSSLQMVTHNVTPLSNLNTVYNGSVLSNVYCEDVTLVTLLYLYNGTLRNQLPADATAINPLPMGASNYIYTTTKESITFYVVAVESTSAPNQNSRIAMYSSPDAFGTPDTVTWINNADKKTVLLSELDRSSPTVYKRIWRQKNPTDTDFNNRTNYYMTKYYIPFDTTAPVMTITYEGQLITDGASIQIERFTPIDNFVNISNSDYTYINIQVDDASATVIEEENTISNTVPGYYTIKFKATDPFLNSSTQTFTVIVADEEPPAVVSNTFIGAGDGHTLNIVLNEEATGIIYENGLPVKTISVATTTPSYTATGLPVGTEYVYTGVFADIFGNEGTLNFGTYVSDLTPPILTVTYNGVQKYHNDNIAVERYSTLGTFSNSATDNVDTSLTVVESGDTVDLLAPPGTTYVRTFTVTDFANNSNVIDLYIDVEDNITPEIIVYNNGTRIFDGDSVTMERLTPIENFINNPNGLNATTNETFATVTESNNFQNTTTTPYTVIFTADDTENTNVATITVNVVDTTPISLLNKTFTGYKDTVSFSADMTELGNVEVKRDGTTVNTWTQVTSFSESFTGLPEGPPANVWTVTTEDNFLQIASYTMGTHTSDVTEPELFLYDYDEVTRRFDGSNVFYERGTTFVDITRTAIDTVDGTVSVVSGGDAPTPSQAVGEIAVRTYTATDSQDNSNVATITFDVRDTLPPVPVSNSVTASEITNEITILATIDELAYLELKRGVTTVYASTPITRTSLNFTDTGLTEGATLSYTLVATDPEGNSNTIPLGSATVGDFTPPIINLTDYGGTPIYDGSQVPVERYDTFTELTLTGKANDNVDGIIDVVSLSAFPDVTERHGTITPRLFRATDTAGNSNTITINFRIDDTVDPVFNTTTPSYDNVTGGFQVNGTMSEECTVSVHSGSYTGTTLDTTDTTGASNAFTLTTSATERYYYVKAYDGSNPTNLVPVLERPLSTVAYLTNTFDGTNNTSNIQGNYDNILHLGASSVIIELASDAGFSTILDTQTVPSGTTSVTSALVPVGSAWSLKTYYVRIRSSGFVTSTYTLSINTGVKPDPPTTEYTLNISTSGRIDIDHLDGPFASVDVPANFPSGENFNYLFDNQFDYSSHDVSFTATEGGMCDFYWGSNTYASQSLYVWMNEPDNDDPTIPRFQDTLHAATITADYGGNTVVTWTANTSSTIQLTGPPYDVPSWRTEFEVASINYTNASTT